MTAAITKEETPKQISVAKTDETNISSQMDKVTEKDSAVDYGPAYRLLVLGKLSPTYQTYLFKKFDKHFSFCKM